MMTMPRMTIRPTQIDKNVARAIARHTDPRIEQSAEALTWGADEHALIAAATTFRASSSSSAPHRASIISGEPSSSTPSSTRRTRIS